jgi:hypothetical protein
MNAPICPNFVERAGCEASNTYVERETDEAFVIRCRTCKGINVWPKERAEGKGRYDAALKKQLLKQQEEEATRRKRVYSYS